MLHEPTLIKTYTNIKQFVKQPFHLNYPNHMQLAEQAVKLTTTASGQYAGAKRQIGEALCVLLLQKNQWIRKNTTSDEKLLIPVNKIKAITGICFALPVFFLSYIISCKQ